MIAAMTAKSSADIWDDALTVSLRWSDHEQGDDLAIGPLVLPDTEMRELEQLLDTHTRVAKDFDDSELPEGTFLGHGDIDVFKAFEIPDSRVGFATPSLSPVVSGGPDPLVRVALDGDGLTTGER